MKVQYCSDLHLEFPENKNYIDKRPLIPEGEMLLLAGDILPFTLNHQDHAFFDFVSDNFEAVYWIPGNHEYYDYDLAKISDPLFLKIRSNVFLANNRTLTYKNVNIICSTLWSYINPVNEWIVQKSLADFSSIFFNGNPFLPFHFNELHRKCLAFIKGETAKYEAIKNIVLTHHVPTFQQFPAKYRKSVLSEGFAVELYDYISDANVDCWIYGHHHFNVPAFKIGNTKMLTNQLGYVRKHEHKSYQRSAVFEI